MLNLQKTYLAIKYHTHLYREIDKEEAREKENIIIINRNEQWIIYTWYILYK